MDSDFEGEEQAKKGLGELKQGAQAMAAAVAKLNAERKDSAIFKWTPGREVENLIPLSAVAHAVQRLANLTPAELKELQFGTLELGRFDRYYEVIESRFNDKKILVNRNGKDVPKGRTLWGSHSSVQ